MKTYLSIFTAILASFLLPALATSEDERWDNIEQERLRQMSHVRGECTEWFRARVREIAPQADGSSRVIFAADGRYVEDKGDMPEGVQKTSGEYTLDWTDVGRPMPWTKGQQVRLGINGGEVLFVTVGEVKIMYCHKRKDGDVEVLAKDNRRWLLIHPNRLGDVRVGVHDLHWVRGIGVVLTSEDAGDAGDAVESQGRSKTGLVPANVPNRPVVPGRDGWVDGNSFFGTEGEPPEGYNVRRRSLIPPAQRIQCAG